MHLSYDSSKLNNICKANNIAYLGLYGSYARGEANKDSDIDLLVRFSKTPSLLGHVQLERKMSEGIFNAKEVDLVTERSLKKSIRLYVVKDLITLYEESEFLK